jgi:hypothetical protein
MGASVVRLTALLLACVVVACGTTQSAEVPTIADARAYLAEVVVLAQRHDFQGVCALSDAAPNCERGLDQWGRNTVPAEAPSVIGTRTIQPTRDAATWTAGGVVLVMCGRDAADNPFNSEMLVFWDGSRLRAINPVYWGNAKIAEGNLTLDAPPTGPIGCSAAEPTGR